jgi:hypothetical protein
VAGDSTGDRRLIQLIHHRCGRFELNLYRGCPLRGRIYLGRPFAPHANYFLLRGQKKVIKEKAAPTAWSFGLPCAPRHFGRARNSLRSDSRALPPTCYISGPAVLGCTDGDPGAVTGTVIIRLDVPSPSGGRLGWGRGLLDILDSCAVAENPIPHPGPPLEGEGESHDAFWSGTPGPVGGAEHRSRAGKQASSV